MFLHCTAESSARALCWLVQCFGNALAWFLACPVLLLCWCAWTASRARSVVVPLVWNWKQPLFTMTVVFFCHFQRGGFACYWFYDYNSTEDTWFFATGLAGIHGHYDKPVTPWLWNKTMCHLSEAASRKFSLYEPLVCYLFFCVCFQTEAFF